MKRQNMKVIFGLLGSAFVAAQAFAQAAPNPTPGPQMTKQFLGTKGSIDLQSETMTLPLQIGALADGRKVYFVITDVSDFAASKAQNLVWAPLLANATKAASTRKATVNTANGELTFAAGTVDFSPSQAVVPGDAPAFFPPKSVQPGSVGDAQYSPLVQATNAKNIVYNAPMIAFDVDAAKIDSCTTKPDYSLVHDSVAHICIATKTVTVFLRRGFADGKHVRYLSFDANADVPATLEQGTYTPATADVIATGASQIIYAAVNGALGVNNPERQGLNSAVAGEGSPLNILDALTEKSISYSPMWDLQPLVWSAAIVNGGGQKRLKSQADVKAASTTSQIVSLDGAPVKSVGFLVNCPVVGFTDEK